MTDRRFYLVRAEGSGEGRTRFVASTAAPDRMGDIIDQRSWLLDAYRQNPVILWAHDASIPPIGRAVSVEVRGEQLEIEVEWDRGHELGANVARQFAEGFLHAGSVGFRPHRATPRSQLGKDDPRRTEGGYGLLFEDNELLEFSAVPVPANAQALAQRGLPVPPEVASLREGLIEMLRSDTEIQRLVQALALGAPMGAAQEPETKAAPDWWAITDEPAGWDGW